MDRETDFFGDVFKIALGIALGGLLLWGVLEYRARYAVTELNAKLEAEAATMQRHRLETAERERRQRAAIQALQRDQAIKAAERANARRIEQQRKETAWLAFYQPRPECRTSASVDCGNAHIRARREFERRYAAGEL